MSKENIIKYLNGLTREEKRLVAFYSNLPEEELVKQTLQFADRIPMFAPKNNNTENVKEDKAKKFKEYTKQMKVIQLTYGVKKYGLLIPKAGGKTRRHAKRRATRKLKP